MRKISSAGLQASPPIQRTTTGAGGRLHGRIYEAIQNRLLEGEYPAGTKLSVEAIRTEFGVSKQPVMEALRLLSADGLVEILPQIGCVVTEYSLEEVEDFFRMFAGFESVIAAAAAQRRTDEHLDEIYLAARRMDRLNTEPDPDIRARQYRVQNRNFHEIIHRMAHSRVMSNMSRRMWDLSDFLINTTGAPHPVGSAIEERNEDHGRIVKALENGDAEAAKIEMENHILSTATMLQATRTEAVS
ncbi:DNA-binding GntR family transcriptional regulator [Arthrobacter bambusae]|uniref:DNA-binding GntR family transcriptional regulator n=1 Tax=Arthrobacter bambusae TaxID=1338426 RepID=A0ABV2P100_9MICC